MKVAAAAPFDIERSSTFCESFRRMGQEEDILWESLISSVKRKRKKEPKKGKNVFKSKRNIPEKTNRCDEKSKQKDAKQRKKDKKKEKKKEKERRKCVAFKTSDIFMSSTNESILIGDTHNKSKNKRKVGFDLSSSCIHVKRPNSASPSPKLSQDKVSSQLSHHQCVEEDSQLEDFNSQDLFITQKTFGPSSSESSGEGAAKAVWKRHADKPRSSRDGVEHLQKRPRNIKRVHRLKKQNKKCSLHTGAGSSLVSHTAKARPQVDEGASADVSPKVAKFLVQQTSLTQTVNTSTQTQNFFTALYSSYLCFRKTRLCAENVHPLDLSLPHRARRHLGRCVEGSDDVTEGREEQAGCDPLSYPMIEEKTEADFGQEGCVQAKRKEDTTPSPLSDSETKSVDTNTSSDCNQASCRSRKLDPIQTRPDETERVVFL
ncbi:uncharacterized protein LOC133568930 isoform X2 [Nerophis ophidion]|uniref:uncharacterized protein LOC133568930 isoform X2 n=1 Tax=Nerophis ophidion TaxID=159077 RepID=UPI002ADFC154|nr:uncharacterized protein LOC133568930 isoform X2 [Nerophis ophidion]